MTIPSPDNQRLRWQCRRGMLELDLLLLRFVDQSLDQLTAQERLAFEHLLAETDVTLLQWFFHDVIPADPLLAALIMKIKSC